MVVDLEGEARPHCTCQPGHCVSAFGPGVRAGLGHAGSPPRLGLGTVTDAEHAAPSSPLGLVRAEPGNVHFVETFEGRCKTV